MYPLKITDGSVINDRFKILSKIGEGGFAVVYRASDLHLERQVALKIMKFPQDENGKARFLREAKLLSKLSHKNIVSVFAFDFLQDSIPFIAMEYLTGKSLQTLLFAIEKLDSEQLRKLLTQCCEGLSYVHQSEVIHRDLSPANIFLLGDLDDFTVKIIDFGVSKAAEGTSATAANLTSTGLLIGNPYYMSPEACAGHKTDQRSDIYSLGCIIYECLSGHKAFDADSTVGIIFKQQQEYPQFPLLRTEGPETDEQLLLADIALRCLQKDPNNRFQSCQEILLYLKHPEQSKLQPVPDKLDTWSEHSKGQSRKQQLSKRQNTDALALKTLRLLKSPKAIAIICLALLSCLVATNYLINSEIGQPVIAKWSLLQNHSKTNLLYWLKKSQELRAQGKQKSADGIFQEIEHFTQGTLILPALYLAIARSALDQGNKDTAFNNALNCFTFLKTFKPSVEDNAWRANIDRLSSESCELVLKSKKRLTDEQYKTFSGSNNKSSRDLSSHLRENYDSTARSPAQQLIQIAELESLIPRVKNNRSYLYAVYMALSIKYSNLLDFRRYTKEEAGRYLPEQPKYLKRELETLKAALACSTLANGHYYQEACKVFQHLDFYYRGLPDFQMTELYAKKALALNEQIIQNPDMPELNSPIKFEYLKTCNIPYICNMHLAQIALTKHELSNAKTYALEALKYRALSNFGWGGEPEAEICLADIAWEYKNKKESLYWLAEFEKQKSEEKRVLDTPEAITSRSESVATTDVADDAYMGNLVMAARWYKAHGFDSLCRKSLEKANDIQKEFSQKDNSPAFHRISKILAEYLAETSKPSKNNSKSLTPGNVTDLNLEYRI